MCFIWLISLFKFELIFLNWEIYIKIQISIFSRKVGRSSNTGLPFPQGSGWLELCTLALLSLTGHPLCLVSTLGWGIQGGSEVGLEWSGMSDFWINSIKLTLHTLTVFSHDETSDGSHHSFVAFSFLIFKDVTPEWYLPGHWGNTSVAFCMVLRSMPISPTSEFLRISCISF